MKKKPGSKKAKFYKKGLRSDAPPTKVIPGKREKLRKKAARKELEENKREGGEKYKDKKGEK